MTTPKTRKSKTPVVDAVLGRDVPRLRAAIAAGEAVDEADSDGRSALHHASIQNQEEVIEILLTLGARASVGDRQGWTPLHYAAQAHAVGIATRLLHAGAAIDAVDLNGNTPLFRAVFESRGRGEMIRLLLEAGADPRRENSHGTSPASLAATISNYEVTKWLKRQ